MVKRIIRAYGAAQDDDSSNVENVARLAGIQRPAVSGNNNFLRAIGVLELDKPKLTPLGVKLATGIGLDNESITTEAMQEVARTTQIFSQLLNTLRARGSMDVRDFKAQVILAAGLKQNSPNLGMIKTVTDLLEETSLVQIRDDKVFLIGQGSAKDNGAMSTASDHDVSTQAATTSPISTTANVPIVEMLLSKFPEFDPTWPDEVKLKWFDAFDRLMKGRGL